MRLAMERSGGPRRRREVRLDQPMQMDDEIARLGAVDGLLRLGAPGALGAGVVGERPTMSILETSRNSCESRATSVRRRTRGAGAAASPPHEPSGLRTSWPISPKRVEPAAPGGFAFAAAKTQVAGRARLIPPVHGIILARRLRRGRPGSKRGASAFGRREKRTAADLRSVVREPFARRVGQPSARLLEQEIGGGDVPVVRILRRRRRNRSPRGRRGTADRRATARGARSRSSRRAAAPIAWRIGFGPAALKRPGREGRAVAIRAPLSVAPAPRAAA